MVHAWSRIFVCTVCHDEGFVGAGETIDACPSCTAHSERLWHDLHPTAPETEHRIARPFDPAKLKRTA